MASGTGTGLQSSATKKKVSFQAKEKMLQRLLDAGDDELLNNNAKMDYDDVNDFENGVRRTSGSKGKKQPNPYKHVKIRPFQGKGGLNLGHGYGLANGGGSGSGSGYGHGGVTIVKKKKVAKKKDFLGDLLGDMGQGLEYEWFAAALLAVGAIAAFYLYPVITVAGRSFKWKRALKMLDEEDVQEEKSLVDLVSEAVWTGET